MFTPSELRDKVFKSGLGYDKKEVEQFMHELSSEYELLLQENADLKKNVSDLSDSIRYYKSIERTLQKALVIAEKTAQDIKAVALKEADATLQEARVKAQQQKNEANKNLELLEHKTLNLIKQYDFFRIQFQNLLHAQSELLNSSSFTINTSDFMYQEEPIAVDPVVPEPEQPAESLTDTDQLKFDFVMEPSEQSYHTEDGFEFITLKDE
jgi:cell division initiation protein